MGGYDIGAARRAMQVPWGEAREERLLRRMIVSSERRARRRQVATWAALALAAGLAFHWMSTAPRGFASGIAGTGGNGAHGRPTSTGVGGNAGTG